ncbi:hypothetical protein KM043_003123 [Ampulex compressa]|nr:hypothetical protein KM043_003123 [Ampulex compressa]
MNPIPRTRHAAGKSVLTQSRHGIVDERRKRKERRRDEIGEERDFLHGDNHDCGGKHNNEDGGGRGRGVGHGDDGRDDDDDDDDDDGDGGHDNDDDCDDCGGGGGGGGDGGDGDDDDDDDDGDGDGDDGGSSCGCGCGGNSQGRASLVLKVANARSVESGVFPYPVTDVINKNIGGSSTNGEDGRSVRATGYPVGGATGVAGLTIGR